MDIGNDQSNKGELRSIDGRLDVEQSKFDGMKMGELYVSTCIGIKNTKKNSKLLHNIYLNNRLLNIHILITEHRCTNY